LNRNLPPLGRCSVQSERQSVHSGLPLAGTHTFFPSCTFFDQHCPTTQVLHKSRIFFTHTMPTAFWRGCFLGQLGPSQRRLPLPSKTLAPFHEELAFCFACGCWLLSCLLWCCGPTRTRTPNLAGSLQPEAPRSTTSVGTWTTLSVRCIANHSTWLCVVRNREGPFAVHIETKFPTPPSTAHIDQLYNSPFTHAHAHMVVPCCAVTRQLYSGPDCRGLSCRLCCLLFL